MKVIEILDALAADPSRLAKERILNANRHNADLMEAVRLALDSLTQFYIRKIPSYTPNKKVGKPSDLQYAYMELSGLSDRKVTGHAAIEHLKYILEVINEKDALVIERIIAKDLRCGVSTSTANKIWADLVRDFPCMLASPFEQKLIDKLKFPAISQLKLDGMRCTAVIENNAVTLYSRNGKILDVHEALDIAMLCTGLNDAAIDGELLIVGNDGVAVDRKTGNGILNKAVKGTISEAEANNILFVAFDLIPLQDFRKEICITPYETRFESLCYAVNNSGNRSKLNVVPSRYVKNQAEISEDFELAIKGGQEGTIVKDPSSVWENKRSKKQIKFKAELDCDLVCVGVEEGTGKYKGKMGALLLESLDGVIKVNVGTGFSDEERKEYFLDQPVGKVIAVCYNARISDKKTGVESLFLPRFLEVREDKTRLSADTSSKIK